MIALFLQVKELARPGELTQNTSFDFEFNQVEKPYETYTGANVRLRSVRLDDQKKTKIETCL